MKFFIAIALQLLTGLALGVSGVLPWWSFSISAALVAMLVRLDASKAFAAGFLGLFMAWGGLAWWIDWQNHSLLSQKMALILPLGGSSAALLLLTGLVAGLLAGLASLAGHFLRAQTQKNQ